jgi:AraC family transcriptional regulator, ethanolamine operon transcriptional activator
MSGNGQRFDGRTLLIAKPGDEFCLAANSPRRWCSLYIPSAELVGANQDAMTAAGFERGVIRLPLQRIESFRSVIRQFDEAVQQAPDAFQSAEAQKAAELKLMREIRNVLAVPCGVEPTHGRHEVPRRQIIRMSMDFVNQHDGEHLSVEQLAASACVSERTLRDAFRGYFGAAPVQYLNQRTLHMARKALKAADPSVTTVTNIAAQFGVWELGRFARDYCYLFGELPSETLRH